MNENINRNDWGFFTVALKEEARTAIWKVGASIDPETLLKSVLKDIEALAPHPETGDTRSDEQIWTAVRELLFKAAYATRPYCLRCGNCCTAGSPTLHAADMDLFMRNVVTPRDVVTIRPGEPVYSNITETAAVAEHEFIKVREKPFTRTCVFYQETDKSCTIYDSRPLQCATQECWAPDRFDEISQQPKLDRKGLLASTGYFWDVVARHEERCSYSELSRAMTRLAATKGQTIEEVIEFLRIDHEVRTRAAERFNLMPDTLDFFFGRSLREAIELYGLKVEEQPGGEFLVTVQ